MIKGLKYADKKFCLKESNIKINIFIKNPPLIYLLRGGLYKVYLTTTYYKREGMSLPVSSRVLSLDSTSFCLCFIIGTRFVDLV